MNDMKQNDDYLEISEEDEINLLDYLLVIVKHKRLILGSCLAAFLISCGIALLMSNVYSATSRILPPLENSSGLSSMLGDVGELASMTGISIGGGGSGELYVGMLQSRTIADSVIDQFELMTVYDKDYRVETYEELEKHVNTSLGKDNEIISIEVEDKDPNRAAEMANAYVSELKKLNIKLNLNNAGRERNFLENRLGIVKKDLKNAEESLKEFQEKNKAIKIDEQAMAIIESISELKGQLASKEVELGVLLSYQTQQNPQVKAIKESIVQIKNQLARLEKSTQGQNVSEDIFIATSDVPELGIQYARLMRDYKTQETLFELLTKQHEIAKINEAKNTSTIQILDEAFPADKKAGPPRLFIVIVATAIAAILSMILAFILEYFRHLKDRDRDLWEKIKSKAGFKKT